MALLQKLRGGSCALSRRDLPQMLRASSDLAGHKGINVELLTVGPEPAGVSLPRLLGNERGNPKGDTGCLQISKSSIKHLCLPFWWYGCPQLRQCHGGLLVSYFGRDREHVTSDLGLLINRQPSFLSQRGRHLCGSCDCRETG